MWEGNFLERIAPGSFKKTLKDRASQIRCLFQHGYDFVVGDKPLGPFDQLREDETGLFYEVPLLSTTYNADLIPGLEAGLYGASFRFRVMREEFVQDPGVSADNPKGLPERTIKELTLFEGGPVTFGAYPEATAGMRSITDEVLVERMARHPDRLRRLVESRAARVGGTATPSERLDSEDVDTLSQMLVLAGYYIKDQDEADEAGNVTAMQSIQSSLIDLINFEAQETEPVESEDEELSAAPSPDETERREVQNSKAPESNRGTSEAPPVEGTPTDAERSTEAKANDEYLTTRPTLPPWYLP